MQEKTRAQLKEFEDIVKKDLERYNKVVECMCVVCETTYNVHICVLTTLLISLLYTF